MLFVRGYKNELETYVENFEDTFKTLNRNSILITGAAGLIGSYIIDLIITANQKFNLNIKVIAVDLNRELLDTRFPDEFSATVQKVYTDVNKIRLDLTDVDYVIHAASNTSPTDYATKPIATMQTNIMATDALLDEAVKKSVKRFLFCSSVEAYGLNNGDTDMFCEDYSGYVNCNTLRAGYPSAKRAAEALCNAYSAEYNLDFVIARIGRIYGPTIISGDAKAPSQFINNAVLSQNIIMKSDGKQDFSFGYVGDCATALLMLLIKGVKGEAYNVAGPDSRMYLRTFAEYAAKAGGTEVIFTPPTEIEKQGYSKVTKATMCMEKLLALGWKEYTTPENGIYKTVQYLKNGGKYYEKV